MGNFKERLKKFIPESLLTATRPIRRYFHPQSRFDRKFNVETFGTLMPAHFDVDNSSRDHASEYAPTLRSTFERIMRHVHLHHPSYVFVDLGSGKGAVLLYASEFSFQKVIGIEFCPGLHRVAERNVANYRNKAVRCKDIETLCMDAAEYDFPAEPTVLFLANPFKGDVLNKVVANIRRSLGDHPRDFMVIYYHPRSRHSAWDRAEFLDELRREPDHTVYRFPR